VEFSYNFGHTLASAVVWTSMARWPGEVGVDVAVGSHLKVALNDG
jgi:hypothetical protein